MQFVKKMQKTISIIAVAVIITSSVCGCGVLVGAGAAAGTAAMEERGISAAFSDKLIQATINSKWLEINLVWTGKHTKFKIHEDSANKLLSVVIYLYPKKNIGTILYSDKLGNDKTIVDWVQNRALIFAREEGVTWHSYQGNGVSTRFALVVNVRSDV